MFIFTPSPFVDILVMSWPILKRTRGLSTVSSQYDAFTLEHVLKLLLVCGWLHKLWLNALRFRRNRVVQIWRALSCLASRVSLNLVSDSTLTRIGPLNTLLTLRLSPPDHLSLINTPTCCILLLSHLVLLLLSCRDVVVGHVDELCVFAKLACHLRWVSVGCCVIGVR